MAFQRLKRGGKTAIAAMQCVLQSASAPKSGLLPCVCIFLLNALFLFFIVSLLGIDSRDSRIPNRSFSDK